jgi:DNA-binding NarL/FixJ family response regulator
MSNLSKEISIPISIAILDHQGIIGIGLKNIIRNFRGFENADISLFKLGTEFADTDMQKFRIIILDSSFKSKEASKHLEKIVKGSKYTSILVLSDDASEKGIQEALKMNANGFLKKDCSEEELEFALIKLVKGSKYYDTDSLLKYSKNLHKKKITLKPDDLHLDEADMQMIRLIADEYTQLEMNEMLKLPTSTIMYLRRRLFAKMKVKNTAGLMRKAINYGLID